MNLAGAVASILLRHLGRDWPMYSDALFLSLYGERGPIDGSGTIAFFVEKYGVYAHPVSVATAIAEFAEEVGVPLSCISVYGDSVIIPPKCLERLVVEARRALSEKYGEEYLEKLQRIASSRRDEIVRKVYESIHISPGNAEWLRGMPIEDVIRLSDIISVVARA